MIIQAPPREAPLRPAAKYLRIIDFSIRHETVHTVGLPDWLPFSLAVYRCETIQLRILDLDLDLDVG